MLSLSFYATIGSYPFITSFMTEVAACPDITVHLTLFHATLTDGEPKLLEHDALAWITPEEIGIYEFCPADRDIPTKIQQEWRTRS